ncbi:serine hydrolase domain-containing protein [Parvularcula sp. LCG005]|uniref:serine hydrolase domain-containing protein n=1 Tax=Parvularcula sp. LCG005 TaxID=3078805 RepID=UPI002942E863|nr:serine hydrolase domain-containing protein [Parvularcula sp. LCG005]WOI53629.1 serine hydrolase domain-containing protein [Parvularcula sp. LCG005]
MTDPVGHCDDRFTAVADVLVQSIESGDNLGASVAVIIGGEPVLDLTAGWKDRQKTTAFGDTLCCVYSAGKAVTAALIMGAVERGEIDYDVRVADIWPAFGAHGKDELTIAQALSHQSGVPGFPEPVDPAIWLDWDATCAQIAGHAPMWPPGTQNGYHPQTFGFIAGEIFRRQTGKTIGTALKHWGVDVYCGLEAPQVERVGAMVKPPAAPDLGTITPPKKAAFLERWSAPAGVDRDQWMAAEIPASNMHATARGLAGVMQAFATGNVRDHVVAGADSRAQATTERIRGDDLVLPFDLSWGAGVMRNTHGYLGPSATAVGHYGFGGALTIADPAHGLSVAFVPNKMSPALVGDPRAIALVEAVYTSL